MAKSKKKMLTVAECDVILANWHVVNETLTTYTEDQVKCLLEREKKHNRRVQIAIRLHTRYCKLRNERERKEMVAAL